MQLPYNRPRLIEVHDQPWCPVEIRQHIQAILTFLWTQRIPLFQSRAPCARAADALEKVVRDIEDGYRDAEKKTRRLRVVDCCSGAGGPMPSIEKRLNANRTAQGRPVLPVLLSDLHPHLPAWKKHAKASPHSALSYIPYPVDALNAPPEVRKGRHIRTFCLSYHHFNEEGARRVLEDAMRTAEAIMIFEMQEPAIGNIITVLGTFPLCFLITPFLRPSLLILFLTYIIPIIPLVLTLDGLVSIWRTRSPQHVRHLANLASLSLNLEGKDFDGSEWTWTHQRSVHTRPFGRMLIVTGKKRSADEVEGGESEEED